VPLGKGVGVKIAREANEYSKKLMADHPGRFGIFATLPLAHVDESLQEIAYAFDTLKVDGIGMLTNYGDKWLGHPFLSPIWEELNRRKATVYTHPADANCCVNLVQGLPGSAIEWGTDSTRSIANLIFSGTSQKYRDINWIFSHGGGALTSFAERFLVQMTSTPPYKEKFTRESVQAELNRFYYDSHRSRWLARSAHSQSSCRCRKSSTALTSRTGRRPTIPRASPRFSAATTSRRWTAKTRYV